ncbi:hypothetical protein [Planctomonas psychrotolerans]|uniref:hypothetical protein n=1 Tax=Planctomonas psychrotolerans TaxID=2528712 RepID=UPI00123C711C|nr:hypothetical protein [Planctomonas psychrotolerans]
MNTAPLPRTILTTMAALLVASTLAGCTMTNDAVYKTRTTTFDSHDSMAGDIPGWIPTDATAITRVQARDGDATSILLTSAEEPDADLCTTTPRLSAPTMQIAGAPDVYGTDGDTVFSCGDWTVMVSPDGWYGWTPVTEDPAAAPPAATASSPAR